MKPTAKKKPASRVVSLLSDQALSEIESVSIRLESGKVAKFDIAAELAVSNDPETLHAQSLTAHSRFAFWEYQSARAKRELEAKEVDVARLLGDRRYRYSKVLKEEDRYVASATVEGMLDGDSSVLAARIELNQLREHWSILRAVAKAHDHRAHLLRRLLAKDQDATRD
jgi:hypothetical protein